MNYLELKKAQERIATLEKQLKEKISFIDENGNRKLNPYYFLSAEVAAYKLISSWVKKMQRWEDFIDDDVLQLLELIEGLIDESYEDYDSYEADYSMTLWYELSKTYKGEAVANFNAEIFVIASLAEVAQGTLPENTLICTVSDEELTDANWASYAYSVAHDYLISLSKEQLEEFARSGFGINASKGELYKLHFNLFE